MAEPIESYVYTPLGEQQIRLLELQPGSSGEPLSGSLIVASLNDENLRYSAISYTWGPPLFSRDILISTRLRHITPSLYDALERFRNTSQPTRLWADALCIHQEDVDERNYQASIMADIYRSAETVLVWLGAATDSDALVFETFTYIGDPTWYELKDVSKQGMAGLFEEPITIPDSEIEEKAIAFAIALTETLGKPYFERLWTLQERCLAQNPTFYTGSLKISSHDWYLGLSTVLSGAYRVLDKRIIVPLGHLRSVMKWHVDLDKAMREAHYSDTTLLQCFRLSANLKCSEPRDRIYGIRAIAGLERNEDLVPNYQ